MEPEYEPVWSGATWRTYPAPVVGSLRGDGARAGVKPLNPNTRQRMCAENRIKLRAAFTDDYQSAVELAAKVGITVQAMRHHLREAMADDVCEAKVYKSTKQWGRAERRYRRVRPAQQEAAA